MFDGMIVAVAVLIVGLAISHARVRNLADEVADIKEWVAEIQMFLEEGIEDEE